MRILLLYWGKRGGGAFYTFEVAKELNRRRDVELYLSISPHNELQSLFHELERPVLSIKTYNSSFGFLKMYMSKKRRVIKPLKKYLIDNRIDLVMTGMDFFWGKSIHHACREAGVPSLYVIHEPKPHPKEPLLMALIKKRTLKQAILSAGHLLTLTNNVSLYIQKHFGISSDRISVIPHGVFSYYRAPGPKELPQSDKSPVTLLFFGRIDYYKGLDILLDAFSILENNDKNLKLEIWGSGDLSAYHAQIKKIKNIRIENRWIDDSEMSDIFQRADICMLPYRDASQSGITGTACAAALPIVACPCEGLKEQLAGTGAILSDDFTPESLADSIKLLLDNPALYKKASGNMLAHADEICWHKIAESIHKLALKLIRQK